MNNWFECKVRYEKAMENGTLKRVTEPYLVDALSFTEAEARIIKEVTPFISGEFTIVDIKRAYINEIFESEKGDKWFKSKLHFITIDERSGAEKKTSVNILVYGGSLDEAKDNIHKKMKGTMADYVIYSITESPLMDIFPYKEEKKEENKEAEETKES